MRNARMRSIKAMAMMVAGAAAWPATAAEVPFAGHLVAAGADGVAAVMACDLDGDGDMDVLAAVANDDRIAWFENGGGRPPSFVAHTVQSGALGATAVTAGDLDGDGDVDVVAALTDADLVAWYRNDGAAPPSFEPFLVGIGRDRVTSVAVADFDGDGAMDVASASTDDDTVAIDLSDGGDPPAFTMVLVDNALDGARSVHAADVDGDGANDLVAAGSFIQHRVNWYRNDGPGGGSALLFSKFTIWPTALGASSVCAADLDDDGDVDVLSASGFDDTIAWYENDGGTVPAFTRHLVTTGADFARGVAAADVDGDGALDVLSASSADDTIAWHESDGASPPAFAEWVISSGADGAVAVSPADLDADGDVDVIAAASAGDAVVWFENLSPPPPECEGDVDGDGAISFDDLLAVLQQWGPCPKCSADLDGNGVVDGGDLAVVVGGWERCPR